MNEKEDWNSFFIKSSDFLSSSYYTVKIGSSAESPLDFLRNLELNFVYV